MFERNIEKELVKWKENPYRKPLILRGARQVGKTSVIRKFAKANFNQVIEINLEKRDQWDFFDKAISVDDFIQRIRLFRDQEVVPDTTLVFIDEIQESKNILGLLRFFAEEKPEIHVIAAGSLLEVNLSADWSIPVGRVEYRFLYPMTFFEYLSAKGKEALRRELDDYHLTHPFTYGKLVSDLFKEYVLIGGMPEAVRSYLETGDIGQTKAILTRYQTAFLDDINKYARSREQVKYLELVINTGPRVSGALFKYDGFGGSNYRSREISEAVQTVEKAMLLRQVPAVNSSTLPITPKMNRPKKMLWLDIGLVNNANQAYQELINGEYKGRIMEQVVGQTLLTWETSRPTELFYWSLDRDEGSAEVDFCFQLNSNFVGMEIKSGSTNKMKSLFSLGNRDYKTVLVRVSWDNPAIETWKYSGNTYKILSLPFYLLDRGYELISEYINAKPGDS